MCAEETSERDKVREKHALTTCNLKYMTVCHFFLNYCSSLANLPASISAEDQVIINLLLAQSTFILNVIFFPECGCCCEIFKESFFQPESSFLCHCSQPQASLEGETKDAGQTARRVCHAIQKGKTRVHYILEKWPE